MKNMFDAPDLSISSLPLETQHTLNLIYVCYLITSAPEHLKSLCLCVSFSEAEWNSQPPPRGTVLECVWKESLELVRRDCINFAGPSTSKINGFQNLSSLTCIITFQPLMVNYSGMEWIVSLIIRMWKPYPSMWPYFEIRAHEEVTKVKWGHNVGS